MGPRERHMRQRAKTHTVPMILVSILGFFVLAGIAFGVGMIANVNRWLSDLPDYTDANQYLVSEPTSILDANGNEIASLYVQNRESVTIDRVSKYVLDATVDTEDERFYEHPGVDFIGIMRAAMVQLTGGSEGASTITQQLVRNTILSEEQFDITIERKVREAWIALKMEEIFSKEEILMMYLNTIYYGHGAYGIEAAARTYYSKSAADLTLAEAAMLTGLPNAPSRYDPTVNYDFAYQRRNTVLARMLRNGHITQEEHDAAAAEDIVLNLNETPDNGTFAYPYFVDYVKSLLQNDFSTDMIFKGGLTVQTTLDPAMQAYAENAVVSQLDKVGLDGLEAGFIALDNSNGHILAMVGGRDYYADEHHVNHSITKRQTGSSFKAFTLAAAIEQGMNPNIMLDCSSPMQITKKWKVQNYGNSSYGTISLARATELSSNTGYAQVAQAIGNGNIIDLCKRIGIKSELENVDAMTLGTSSLSVLEMAEAYSTFANGGLHRETVAISKVTARDGDVLYEHVDAPEQVVDAGVVQVTTNVLEGVINGGRGATGAAARLSVNQPFAGKTGTSTDTCDLWFCGYTPQITVSVWSGYTSGSVPIWYRGREALGSDITLPMVRNFLNNALEGVERGEFPTGNPPTYKADASWTKLKPIKKKEEESEEETPTEEPTDTPAEQPTDTPATDPTPDPTPTPPSGGGNENPGGGNTGGGDNPGGGGNTGGGGDNPGGGGGNTGGGGTNPPGGGGETPQS